MKFRVIALACAVAFASAEASAAPVTIGFELVEAPVLLFQGDSYLESGFTFTASIAADESFAINEEGNASNNGFAVGALPPGITVDDTATVTRGGATFRFLSVDYSSFPGGIGATFLPSDEAKLIGFLGGIEVALFATLSSSQGYQTFLNSLANVVIDELRIVGSARNQTTLSFDNFVFDDANVVPLPAAAPLFLAGLAGFVATRRPRKAR